VNSGKTLFAQLMDFLLPWSTFTRIVSRYGGDWRVRTLSCAEQYRAMAFAQLTYRESLRDIETCLSAQAAKLYAMGFGDPVRRSTLADANEARDWRIYAELAQRLIVQARTAVHQRGSGFRPQPIRSMRSTRRPSIFVWPSFRGRISARPRRRSRCTRCWIYAANIPSFIHVSDGKLHDVHALDLLLSRKRAPSTSWIAATSISPASMGCISPAPSSSPAPNRT